MFRIKAISLHSPGCNGCIDSFLSASSGSTHVWNCKLRKGIHSLNCQSVNSDLSSFLHSSVARIWIIITQFDGSALINHLRYMYMYMYLHVLADAGIIYDPQTTIAGSAWIVLQTCLLQIENSSVLLGSHACCNMTVNHVTDVRVLTYCRFVDDRSQYWLKAVDHDVVDPMVVQNGSCLCACYFPAVDHVCKCSWSVICDWLPCWERRFRSDEQRWAYMYLIPREQYAHIDAI